MALTKVTGQVIKNTTDVTVGVLTVTNTLAVGGTVSIGGTLTYEDVTNVDAVGLITARNGIVVGSGITLSKDGDIFATGITTVTTVKSTTGIVTTLTATGLTVDSGTTNTCATFKSTDAGAVINLTDSAARSSIEQNDTTLKIIADTDASDADSKIQFQVDASTKATIDSSGRLLIGNTTTLPAFGASSSLQVAGTGFASGSMLIRRDSDNAFSGALVFGKSRGSLGGNTVVQSGDQVGSIIWTAADGTDLTTDLAQIKAKVDGTPGSNDMPGRIEFHTTADGASGVTERLRIDSSGRLLIGTTTEGFATYGDKLTIADSGHCGMTIRSGASNYGTIYFSDGDDGSADEVRGFLEYYHSDNALSLGTDGVSRLRIDSLGQVGINTASPTCHLEVVSSKTKTWTPTTQTELLVERSGNCIVSIVGNNDADCILNFSDSDDENPGAINYDHATDNMIFRVNGGNRAKFLTDGRFVLGSPTIQTTVDYSVVTQGRLQTEGSYSATSSSSANVRIGSSGLFTRSTSSARYKKDIADATWGLADVLKLKPKTFKSNATGVDADDNTYGGFIAEDVHDIGLTNFVEYNDDNQPDAVHYGNMVALMTKAIQEQQEKIEILEAEVAALKSS